MTQSQQPAEALERLARREQRPQVAATLQLAAAQLRDDHGQGAPVGLLALITAERLSSVAALLPSCARPRATRWRPRQRRI